MVGAGIAIQPQRADARAADAWRYLREIWEQLEFWAASLDLRARLVDPREVRRATRSLGSIACSVNASGVLHLADVDSARGWGLLARSWLVSSGLYWKDSVA